jgi:hypothetical protein
MPIKTVECNTGKSLQTAREYSRILTAAVISTQFRRMLLDDPSKAISAGFGGEKFHLDNEDQMGIASIRATTLADFASELNRIGPPSVTLMLPLQRT